MQARTTLWWASSAVGLLWVTACEGSSTVDRVDDVPGGPAGSGGASTAGKSGGPVTGGRAGSGVGGEAGEGATVGVGGAGGSTGARGGTGATAGDAAGGVGASGGTGGRAGAGSWECRAIGALAGTAGSVAEAGAGGEGGESGESGDCAAGAGCLFARGDNVRAIAADDTHVYWLEYGATDQFRNYSHDGRLRARAFDGSDDRTLIAGLDGPLELAVTRIHVYVYLDGGDSDSENDSLVRVPIGGAVGERLFDGETPQRNGGWCGSPCTASRSDRDFVVVGGDIYSIPTSECAAPELVLDVPDDNIGRIAVDDSHVYFVTYSHKDGDSERWSLLRASLGGGEPEALSDFTHPTTVAVAGDYVYAQNTFEDYVNGEYYYPSFLAQAPKDTANTWTRIASLGDHLRLFRVAGERYFADSWDPSLTGISFVTGVFSDPTTVDSLPFNVSPTWTPSPVGVFQVTGNTDEIRLLALP